MKRHEKAFSNLKRKLSSMILLGVAGSSSRGGGRMLWAGIAVRQDHKVGKSEPRGLPALQGLVRGCIVTESDGPNADLNTTCQLHPTSTSSRMFRVSPEEHCVFVRNSAGRCPTCQFTFMKTYTREIPFCLNVFWYAWRRMQHS